jgi:hypothetical protein
MDQLYPVFYFWNSPLERSALAIPVRQDAKRDMNPLSHKRPAGLQGASTCSQRAHTVEPPAPLSQSERPEMKWMLRWLRRLGITKPRMSVEWLREHDLGRRS